MLLLRIDLVVEEGPVAEEEKDVLRTDSAEEIATIKHVCISL